MTGTEEMFIAKLKSGTELTISIGRNTMGNFWIIKNGEIVVRESLQVLCLNANYPNNPYRNSISIDKENFLKLLGIKISAQAAIVEIVAYADGSELPRDENYRYQVNQFKGNTLKELKLDVLSEISKAKKRAEQKNKTVKPVWKRPQNYSEAYEIGGLDYAEEGNWDIPPSI